MHSSPSLHYGLPFEDLLFLEQFLFLSALCVLIGCRRMSINLLCAMSPVQKAFSLPNRQIFNQDPIFVFLL